MGKRKQVTKEHEENVKPVKKPIITGSANVETKIVHNEGLRQNARLSTVAVFAILIAIFGILIGLIHLELDASNRDFKEDRTSNITQSSIQKDNIDSNLNEVPVISEEHTEDPIESTIVPPGSRAESEVEESETEKDYKSKNTPDHDMDNRKPPPEDSPLKKLKTDETPVEKQSSEKKSQNPPSEQSKPNADKMNKIEEEIISDSPKRDETLRKGEIKEEEAHDGATPSASDTKEEGKHEVSLTNLYLEVESVAEKILKEDPKNEMVKQLGPHLEGVLKDLGGGKVSGIRDSLLHMKLILVDLQERLKEARETKVSSPKEKEAKATDKSLPKDNPNERVPVDEIIPDPIYIAPLGKDGEEHADDLKTGSESAPVLEEIDSHHGDPRVDSKEKDKITPKVESPADHSEEKTSQTQASEGSHSSIKEKNLNIEEKRSSSTTQSRSTDEKPKTEEAPKKTEPQSAPKDQLKPTLNAENAKSPETEFDQKLSEVKQDSFKRKDGTEEVSDNVKRKEGTEEASDNVKRKEGTEEASDNVKQKEGTEEASDNVKRKEGAEEASDNVKRKEGTEEASDNVKRKEGTEEASDTVGKITENNDTGKAQTLKKIPSTPNIEEKEEVPVGAASVSGGKEVSSQGTLKEKGETFVETSEKKKSSPVETPTSKENTDFPRKTSTAEDEKAPPIISSVSKEEKAPPTGTLPSEGKKTPPAGTSKEKKSPSTEASSFKEQKVPPSEPSSKNSKVPSSGSSSLEAPPTGTSSEGKKIPPVGTAKEKKSSSTETSSFEEKKVPPSESSSKNKAPSAETSSLEDKKDSPDKIFEEKKVPPEEVSTKNKPHSDITLPSEEKKVPPVKPSKEEKAPPATPSSEQEKKAPSAGTSFSEEKKDRPAGTSTSEEKTKSSLESSNENLIEEETRSKKKTNEQTKDARFEKATAEDVPESVKSLLEKAKALYAQSEEEQSNVLLEEAINAYENILNLFEYSKSVPTGIAKEAGVRCAELLNFRGRFQRAGKVLRRLELLFPDDVTVRNKIGVLNLMMNQEGAAKRVFESVLKVSPSDGFAMAHYGFILKLEGENYTQAIDYLEKGIKSGADGVEDSRFYYQIGDALQRIGQRDRAYEFYDAAVAKGLFLNRYQRSVYNVDRLKSKPVWSHKETTYEEYFAKIESHWRLIKEEGLKALSLSETSNGKFGFRPELENLRDTGHWTFLDLFVRGNKVVNNCKVAPVTCSLIESFKPAATCRRGQSKFSLIEAGTHVFPHTGPTNCRLRSHLGLVTPKGAYIQVVNTTIEWNEGKLFIFDDSYEHEVWHNGTGIRLILIVDLWHPELSEAERKTLKAI